MLNEGLKIVGTDGEEFRNEIGAFERSGIKEIVLPSTLVELAKSSFKKCLCLKRVWVEQHCQIRIKDYVESDVDVRVFQAGDRDLLESIRRRAKKDE